MTETLLEAAGSELARVCTAMVRADVHTLAECLMPDFAIDHLAGRTQTRDEWLHDLGTTRMRYHSIRTTGFALTGTDSAPVLVVGAEMEATIAGAYATWPVEMRVTLAPAGSGWRFASTSVVVDPRRHLPLNGRASARRSRSRPH